MNELIKLEENEKKVYEVKDYDTLSEKLKIEVESYRIANINEDTYKLAKSNKSKLNKLIDEVNDSRIASEKAYMIPFNNGKEQCNALIKIIKEVSDELDKGIKAIDETDKNEKYEEINTYFNSVNKFPITLDKILDKKWLNKSIKMDEVKKDIDNRLMLIDYDILKLKTSIEDKADLRVILFMYFNGSMNLTETLQTYEKYLTIEASIESLI